MVHVSQGREEILVTHFDVLNTRSDYLIDWLHIFEVLQFQFIKERLYLILHLEMLCRGWRGLFFSGLFRNRVSLPITVLIHLIVKLNF